MAKPSENNFIPPGWLICTFGSLSIFQILSKPEFVHLHSLNPRPLLFSPYHNITVIQQNRHEQFPHAPPSTCRLTALTRHWWYLQLTSHKNQQHLYRIHPKHTSPPETALPSSPIFTSFINVSHSEGQSRRDTASSYTTFNSEILNLKPFYSYTR